MGIPEGPLVRHSFCWDEHGALHKGSAAASSRVRSRDGEPRGALGAHLVNPQAPSGGLRSGVGRSSKVLGMHRGELEGSLGRLWGSSWLLGKVLGDAQAVPGTFAGDLKKHVVFSFYFSHSGEAFCAIECLLWVQE